MIRIAVAVAAIAIIAVLLKNYLANSQNSKQHKQEGDEFLKLNANEEGVQVTASGLQYKWFNKTEGGVMPKASDRVTVHYHGTLIDGTVFDSSINRGAPIGFGLNQVIKGWTEGLQLMTVGDKIRLYIPSHLAYGNRNMGKIPPGSVLIFDVELLAINE
jgi:peptidylprolyl isomerase